MQVAVLAAVVVLAFWEAKPHLDGIRSTLSYSVEQRTQLQEGWQEGVLASTDVEVVPAFDGDTNGLPWRPVSEVVVGSNKTLDTWAFLARYSPTVAARVQEERFVKFIACDVSPSTFYIVRKPILEQMAASCKTPYTSFFDYPPWVGVRFDSSAASQQESPVQPSSECVADNTFRAGGTVADAQLQGFSAAEPDGRWTDSTKASFTCDVPQTMRGLPATLEVAAGAYLPLPNSQQRITLSSGGVSQTFLVKAGEPAPRIAIDLPRLRAKLHVAFDIPDATSPSAAGQGTDSRQLGFAFRDLFIHLP